jgi:hypothetical protein
MRIEDAPQQIETEHARLEAEALILSKNIELTLRAVSGGMAESMAGNASHTITDRQRGRQAFNFLYRTDNGEILVFTNYRDDARQRLAPEVQSITAEASMLMATDTRQLTRFLSQATDSFPTASEIVSVFASKPPTSVAHEVLEKTRITVNQILQDRYKETEDKLAGIRDKRKQ